MPLLDELVDLLNRVIGVLIENDLQDPEMASLLSQTCAILEPIADPMPKAMVEHFRAIDNPVERFKQAALKLGSFQPEELKVLVDSMKTAGLLKSGT